MTVTAYLYDKRRIDYKTNRPLSVMRVDKRRKKGGQLWGG